MSFFKVAIRPSILIALLVSLSIGAYLIFNTAQVSVKPESTHSTIENQLKTYSEERVPNAPKSSNTDNETNFDFAALDLRLLAAIVANPINQSTAVIQAKDLVTLYKLNEKIKQTELSIAAIYHNYIVLVLDDQEFELRLSAKPNTDFMPATLQETEIDIEQAARDKKQAKEIGNRPKELEHIVVITPASNGFYVTPGLNPALFRAAKFQEGDVLQTINGKDVNDPDAFAEAKALIAIAETLKFTVLRDGGLVTLYLDIPAQDLSISR